MPTPLLPSLVVSASSLPSDGPRALLAHRRTGAPEPDSCDPGTGMALTLGSWQWRSM